MANLSFDTLHRVPWAFMESHNPENNVLSNEISINRLNNNLGITFDFRQPTNRLH